MATADLMDECPKLKVVTPSLQDFGGIANFYGQIKTISCFEDNSKVRERLEKEKGTGCVLVIDGAGSKRCALIGDNLVRLAIENDWSGIIVNGCIRDSEVIKNMQIGIKALATNPRKSIKKNQGLIDIDVSFLDATFIPNQYIYCDSDGVIVSENKLH